MTPTPSFRGLARSNSYTLRFFSKFVSRANNPKPCETNLEKKVQCELAFTKFCIFGVQVSPGGAIGEVCLNAPQDIHNVLYGDK